MRKTDDVERDAELDQERVVDDATLEVNRKIFRAEDDESAVAGGLIQIFNSKRDAPTWPTSFRPKTPPSVVRNSVNNATLLPKLREKERGDWKKIYEDGYDGANRISVHYFQSPSGKVFNVKVKQGWSNG